MVGYIYLITHRETGRGYIGQTTTSNPFRRWRSHVCDASTRFRCTIDRAIAKYGEGAFDFEVLTSATSQKELDNLETLWIIMLGTSLRGVGFNIRGGGSRGRHSEETKQKLREARKRQVITPEMYKKGAERRKGFPRTPQWLQRQSESRKGWNPSPETRRRMSESAKRRAARTPRDHSQRFVRMVPPNE